MLRSNDQTEKVGFEPTAPFGVTGFQDRLLKPLGHLSKTACIVYHSVPKMSSDFFLNRMSQSGEEFISIQEWPGNTARPHFTT